MVSTNDSRCIIYSNKERSRVTNKKKHSKYLNKRIYRKLKVIILPSGGYICNRPFLENTKQFLHTSQYWTYRTCLFSNYLCKEHVHFFSNELFI